MLVDSASEFIDEIPRWFRMPELAVESSLFPEYGLTIFCPLEAPFSHMAITHFGTIFRHKPLRTIGSTTKKIHPSAIVPSRMVGGTRVVTLASINYKRTYILSRLLVNRFFNIPLYDSTTSIEYVDDDNTNIHIANIEVYTRIGRRRLIPYEYT